MKKRVLKSLLAVLLVISLVSFSSAEILLSPSSSGYSIGDDFSLSATVIPNSDTNGFFTADLVCDNSKIEIYRTPLNLNALQETNLTVNATLDKSLVNNIVGNCYIDANFGSDEVKSSSFEISNKIDLNISLSDSTVDPGNQFTLSGTATKRGNNVNGYINITISGIGYYSLSEVSNGTFSQEISIPENLSSGIYAVSSDVYEKDSQGNIANEGTDSSMFIVRQIAKKADVAINAVNLTPPANLSYIPLLYDQAGKEMQSSLIVSVYDPSGSLYVQRTDFEGQSNLLSVPNNASPGNWVIESSYAGLSSKVPFFVSEVQKASFTLDNQTLIVKNVGNVPYSKTVEITIGSDKEVKSFNLNVGEEQRFKLTAPDGNYDISIKEDETSLPVGSAYLTGNAVAVKSLNSLSSGFSSTLWIWIIVIIVLLAVALYYYRKVRSKSYFGKTPSFSSPIKRKLIPITQSSFPSKEVDSQARKTRIETYDPESLAASASSASSSLSSNDNKEEVVVIAVKIKNEQKLKDSESSAYNTIEHILQKARLAKAKVYDQGAFKVIILSSRITQKTELENYASAVKLANQIDETLREFNKKYAIKIDYGIGANVGQMFVEFVDNKVKFTSFGNTVILAKNAAEKANNELLISQGLHRKVYNIVKGDVTPYGLYKVNSILDRTQHSQFIQRFMKK